MMEKDSEARELASKRFSNPSKLADAQAAWSVPERGPNVGAIYTDDAVKKLLTAVVSKDARKGLAEIEIEKGIKRATQAKVTWLESHLAEKGITRGDGDTWKAAQLKPILESFGWAPLPGATRGPRRSSGNAGGKPAPKSKVDTLLLAFMPEEEEEETAEDGKHQILAQLRTELSNIEAARTEAMRKLVAADRARQWWTHRIQTVDANGEDPGATPPEGWNPEETTDSPADEAIRDRARSIKRRTSKKKTSRKR